MSKKRLKRIEAKLDYLIEILADQNQIEVINKSIGGGGIKKPPTGGG